MLDVVDLPEPTIGNWILKAEWWVFCGTIRRPFYVCFSKSKKRDFYVFSRTLEGSNETMVDVKSTVVFWTIQTSLFTVGLETKPLP